METRKPIILPLLISISIASIPQAIIGQNNINNTQKDTIKLDSLRNTVSMTDNVIVPTDSVETEMEIFKNLPEVMIQGERPIAKLENGKLSFNIPLLLKSLPASNAYEALQQIPGVNENDGSLSYANRPVSLIINGKTSSLSYEQIVERLKTIPAQQIAKAEVMMSAPPRFHVRGAAINIVTKDYVGMHMLTGQLLGSWKQDKYGSGKVQGNMTYVNNKFSLDTQYSFSDGKSAAKAEHSANHPLGDERIPYYDCIENTSSLLSHNYFIGSEYSFAKSHTLSLAYTGKWSRSDLENQSMGTDISQQNSVIHNYMNNVDMNYNLPFGLTLGASYLNYRYPKKQNLSGYLLNEEKEFSAQSNQRINKWLFTADQSHNLKNGWGISYGAKMQQTRNDSYQTTKDATGQPIAEATSEIEINERILNAYTGFSKQFGETGSLELSATVENFHTPRWNSWKIYPELNVLWNVDERNLLNLSFNSDAQYPSYWSTMSSIYYSSIYSEIWGNPELKPSNNFTCSFMWQHDRRYTMMMFANFMPDYFVQLPYQPSDRMAVIMKVVNFDYRNQFGLQTSAQFSAGKWLSGNAFATLVYNQIKDKDFFDIPFKREKISGIFGMNASIGFGKEKLIRLGVNPFLQTPCIQGVMDLKTVFRLNTSLRWNSKDEIWTVILSGNNITDGFFKMHSQWANQDFYMRVSQNRASVKLTAIYKIGNYKEKKKKEVDTSRMGY